MCTSPQRVLRTGLYFWKGLYTCSQVSLVDFLVPMLKLLGGYRWLILSRKFLEGVPDTLQEVTSSFAKGILRDCLPISSRMDDRNLNKVYWSCHGRGHTSFKLLVDYHSTVNGWAGSTQGFNLHIYNLLCSQNCLFRVPLQQLHSRENIFKEPRQLPSAFFSQVQDQKRVAVTALEKPW